MPSIKILALSLISTILTSACGLASEHKPLRTKVIVKNTSAQPLAGVQTTFDDNKMFSSGGMTNAEGEVEVRPGSSDDPNPLGILFYVVLPPEKKASGQLTLKKSGYQTKTIPLELNGSGNNRIEVVLESGLSVDKKKSSLPDRSDDPVDLSGNEAVELSLEKNLIHCKSTETPDLLSGCRVDTGNVAPRQTDTWTFKIDYQFDCQSIDQQKFVLYVQDEYSGQLEAITFGESVTVEITGRGPLVLRDPNPNHTVSLLVATGCSLIIRQVEKEQN